MGDGQEHQRVVLVFGTFDGLHAGHRRFLQQARALGDYLMVVVARDGAVVALKGRQPQMAERDRLAQVAAVRWVDEARLGDRWPPADQYGLLERLAFDVVALGYDQEPSDEVVVAELAKRGKEEVEVVRLGAWRPGKYKSSLLRRNS